MATSKLRKKIVWAIDAFGDAKHQVSAANLARALNVSNDVEVVYVMGRMGLSQDTDRAQMRLALKNANSQLKILLKQLKFKTKRKAEILVHGSEYVRMDVKTLVKYAKKSKTDAILVSTHARSGFMRQALGSFAETLILESTIPVMVVNPKAKIAAKPGSILFPTDFSAESWKAFRQVVSFAKQSKTTVKIFHQFAGEAHKDIREIGYFRFNPILGTKFPVDRELRYAKKKLFQWLAFAKQQNVPCEHVIKYGLRNIADATLELAQKEKVWMIAMATVTGAMSATFLGSNARWVLRSANCPVWVLYVKGK